MDLDLGDEDGHAGSAAVTGLTAEEKRQRRLERNRESARLSRLRKKQHLSNLSDEVDALSTELGAGLLKTGRDVEDVLNQKRAALLAEVASVLEAKGDASTTLAPDEELFLRRAIDFCVQAAGPNSVERQLVRSGRFDALRRLLLGPGDSLAALLAYSFSASSTAASSASGTSTSSSGASSGSTINAKLESVCLAWWASLCQEIPLTKEQAEALRDGLAEAAKSPDAAAGSAKLDALLSWITKLEADLNASSRKAQQELDAASKILDCRQMTKLLLWMYPPPPPPPPSATSTASQRAGAGAGTGAPTVTARDEPLS